VPAEAEKLLCNKSQVYCYTAYWCQCNTDRMACSSAANSAAKCLQW